jgi:hypothetical protein
MYNFVALLGLHFPPRWYKIFHSVASWETSFAKVSTIDVYLMSFLYNRE